MATRNNVIVINPHNRSFEFIQKFPPLSLLVHFISLFLLLRSVLQFQSHRLFLVKAIFFALLHFKPLLQRRRWSAIWNIVVPPVNYSISPSSSNHFWIFYLTFRSIQSLVKFFSVELQRITFSLLWSIFRPFKLYVL